MKKIFLRARSAHTHHAHTHHAYTRGEGGYGYHASKSRRQENTCGKWAVLAAILLMVCGLFFGTLFHSFSTSDSKAEAASSSYSVTSVTARGYWSTSIDGNAASNLAFTAMNDWGSSGITTSSSMTTTRMNVAGGSWYMPLTYGTSGFGVSSFAFPLLRNSSDTRANGRNLYGVFQYTVVSDLPTAGTLIVPIRLNMSTAVLSGSGSGISAGLFVYNGQASERNYSAGHYSVGMPSTNATTTGYQASLYCSAQSSGSTYTTTVNLPLSVGAGVQTSYFTIAVLKCSSDSPYFQAFFSASIGQITSTAASPLEGINNVVQNIHGKGYWNSVTTTRGLTWSYLLGNDWNTGEQTAQLVTTTAKIFDADTTTLYMGKAGFHYTTPQANADRNHYGVFNFDCTYTATGPCTVTIPVSLRLALTKFSGSDASDVGLFIYKKAADQQSYNAGTRGEQSMPSEGGSYDDGVYFAAQTSSSTKEKVCNLTYEFTSAGTQTFHFTIACLKLRDSGGTQLDVGAYIGTPYVTYTPTVTYNANGGTIGTSSSQLTYGNEYGTIPVPTRTGYTFNGWSNLSTGLDASAGLPSDYQRVEYLMSTSGGGQYINTGIAPNNNTGIEVVAKLTSPYSIFGVNDVNGHFNITSGGSNDYFYWGINNGAQSTTTAYHGKKTIYALKKGVATRNNGETSYTYPTQSWSSSVSMPLFGRKNESGTFNDYGECYIYACKIWDNDVLVRDYIPCYRKSDGARGMYDLVYKTFNTNAGSGTFAIGSTEVNAPTVTEIGSLPSTYQYVDYVVSSGTQFINTGVKPTNKTSIEIDSKTMEQRSPFGSVSTGKDFNLTYGDSKSYFHWGGTSEIGKSTTTYFQQRAIFKLDQGKCYKNGVLVGTGATSTWSSDYPIYLFGRNASGVLGDSGISYIYSCKIWEDGILLRNYIPCYRKSDSVIGLYDTVYGDFYTNAGSGTFSKGADVKDIVSEKNNYTLYAMWTPNVYNVSYNANKPSTAMGSVSSLPATSWKTYDVNFDLASTPTLTGWTFDGWYNGSTKVGGGGASVSNLISTSNGSVTLDAHWTANTYTVTYFLDGGANGSHAPTTGWKYDTADYVSAPTRAGYTFTGWTVSGADSSTAKWGTSSSPSTEISSSSTNCFNTATGNVYFKNLTSTNNGSITFTAHWTAKTFTLSYDAQGGTTPSSKSVTFASEFGTLATTTRTGYTFQGWSLLPTGYQQVEYIQSAGNGNTENVGGYILTDITPNGNSSIRMVAEPTATGQYHAFWVARGATTSTSTWTLFGINNGKYRFDYGNSTAGTTTATYSTTKTTLVAEKNRFYIGTTLGYAYDSLSDYTAGGPLMFLASYYDGTSNHIDNRAAVKIYGITYWNNGTVAAYLVPCYRKSDGAIGLYNIVGSSNNFYPCTGTLTKGSDVYVTATTEFAVGGDTTLHAIWEANPYTVVYDGNKPNDATHDVENVPSNATWVYDRNETLAAKPSLNGWTFTGWYKNQACDNNMRLGGEKVLTSTPPNLATGAGTDTSYTLYAGWSKNGYTVTYNANKPEGASGNVTSVPASATWYYDSNVTLADGPTLTGWTFVGWYKESTGVTAVSSVKPNLVMSGSTSVYAKWTANTYTVAYHENKQGNATGEVSTLPSDDVKTYDIAFTLASTPTLTGWTFGGWYSESTCQEANKVGNAGESVTNLTATNGATFDIYAKWTANTYTVVYNGNKPSNASHEVGNIPDNGTWTYDGTVTFGGSPTLTGWTFGGWYEESTCETAVSTTKPNLATGEGSDTSYTIYAKWTPNTYTVSFTDNKPTGLATSVTGVPTSETWTYDEDESLPAAAPSLTGWNFAGWYKEASCVNKVGDEDEELTKPNLVTGDGLQTSIGLYAKWELKKPTVVLTKDGVAANFEVVYDTVSVTELVATATHECGQVLFAYEWKRTKEGGSAVVVGSKDASGDGTASYSASNGLDVDGYLYEVKVTASYSDFGSVETASIVMTILQKDVTVTIVEKSESCEEEFGPVAVERSGSVVVRVTDTACDALGEVRRNGTNVSSVTSEHDNARMLAGYEAAFDGLVGAYTRYRVDTVTTTVYEAFYNEVRALFDNSFREGTGETEYTEYSGAVVGIAGDDFIGVRSALISSDRDEYTELLSRVFGFESKADFIEAAEYIGTAVSNNATNGIGASAISRLPYRGGVYTSGGTVVLPYSVAVRNGENWEDKVLLFFFAKGDGSVSVWVNSYESLYVAANGEGGSATRVRIYGRCELFDTPYYMYDGTAKAMETESAVGVCTGHEITSMTLVYAGNASVKDYGSYAVTVGSFGVQNTSTGEDVTGNYRIVYASSKTMTIEKMRLIFRPVDAETTYNGSAFAGSIAYTLATGDRLVNRYSGEDVSYGLNYNSGATATNAGAYVMAINTSSDVTIKDEFNENKESNYDTAGTVFLNGYLKIKKKAVTVRASDYSNTYGESLTASVFGYEARDEGGPVLLLGLSVMYQYGADEGHLGTGLAEQTQFLIDPGTYVLKATLTGDMISNYDFTYELGEITIATREINLLISEETVIYGTAATMAIGEGIDAYPLLAGDAAAMEYEYSLNGVDWVSEVKDVGEYLVRAKEGTVHILNNEINRDKYYTIASIGQGQLTINRKVLTMTVTSSVTYNGLIREYVPFGTAGEDLLTWSLSGCIAGESFSSPVFGYATSPAPKDAGVYECSVTSFVISGGQGKASNYEIGAWEYTIAPFTPSIAIGDEELTYGNVDHAFNGEITITLASGETGSANVGNLVFTYYEGEHTLSDLEGRVALGYLPREAGVYTVKVTADKDQICPTPANYNAFIYVDRVAVMTIEKKSLTVRAKETEFPYANGEEIPVEGVLEGWATGETVADGYVTFGYVYYEVVNDEITENVVATPSVVGTYGYKITVTLNNEGLRRNYCFAEGYTTDTAYVGKTIGKMAIADRRLYFAVNSNPEGSVHVYNGRIHTPNSDRITMTGDGLLEGDAIAYTFEYSRDGLSGWTSAGGIDAGTWYVRFGVSVNRTTDAQYVVRIDDGSILTLEIEKRAITVDVDSQVYTYNCQEQSGKSVVSVGSLVEAITDGETEVRSADIMECTYSYSQSGVAVTCKDVGTYDVAITGVTIYQGTTDITENYEITIGSAGTVTINRAKIAVRVPDVGSDEIYYNGSAKEIAYTVNGEGWSDTITATFTYEKETEAGENEDFGHVNAGTWDVLITSVTLGAGVDKNNYQSDIDVVLVRASSEETVTYSGGDIAESTENGQTIFALGGHTDKYSTMVISPKKVNVILTPKTEENYYVYNRDSKTVDIDFEGKIAGNDVTEGEKEAFGDGVTLIYTYKGANVSANGVFHAGDYTVTLNRVTSSSIAYAVRNYTFESDGTSFTVEKNTIELKFRTDGPNTNVRTTEFTLGTQTATLAELSSETAAYSDGIRVRDIVPVYLYQKSGSAPTGTLPTDSGQIGEWAVSINSASFAAGENQEIWTNDYAFNVQATSVLNVEPKEVRINVNENTTYTYDGTVQEVQFVFSGLLQLDESVGTETITVNYNVTVSGSTETQMFKNARTYNVKYMGVTYEYAGEGSGYEDCYNWVPVNYDERLGWECEIAPKPVTVAIEAKETDGYTYNKNTHEMVATATGLIGNDATNFECDLVYSYQTEGTRVWVTPGSGGKWYVYDVSGAVPQRTNTEAENKYRPIYAGTLDVKIFYPTCNNIDTNYDYVYEDGVMEIGKFHTTIVLGGDDIEYDGEEHGVSVRTDPRITDIDPNIQLTAQLEACLQEVYDADPEHAVWSESIVQVGNYYVSVKEGGIQVVYGNSSEDESGNYEFTYPDPSTYGELRITPKKLTLQLENYVGVYNGEGHVPTQITVVGILDQDRDKISVEVEEYIFTNQSGGLGDNVNANENVSGANCYVRVASVKFSDGSDADTMKNYCFPAGTADDYISNRATITIRKAYVTFVIDSTAQTYDGEEHEAVVRACVIDPETYNAETGEGIVKEGAYGDDVIVPSIVYLSDKVNAGTCEAEIRRASAMSTNYELVASSGSFEIEPMEITVSFIDAVTTYDGKAKGLALSYEPTLKHDHADFVGYTLRYSLDGVTIDGAPTNAEANAYIASITEIGLNCPVGREEENGNYVFTYRSARGSLTIEKAEYDFSEFESYLENHKDGEGRYFFTAEYNGEEQVPEFGDNIPKGADVRRYYLEAVFDGSVREVSDELTELRVTFVGRRTGEEGERYSPNYIPPENSYTVYFQLVKKTVAVEWGPSSKEEGGRTYIVAEYNGKGKDAENKYKTTPTATIENGRISLSVNITTEGYQGNVSYDERGNLRTSYRATAVLEGTNANNYTLTGEDCSFVVVAKKVTVQFSGHNLVYNGNNLTIDAKIGEGQVMDGDVVSLIIKTDRAVLNAGDYTATVEIDKEAEGEEGNCYELVGNTFAFTVGKRDAVIIANDASSVYGEATATFGYTSENFFKDDLRRLNLDLTCENGQRKVEDGLTVWQYDIVPVATSSSYKVEFTGERYTITTMNYNVTFVKGKYTVYPKNITVVIHDQTQIDPNSSELISTKGVGWDAVDPSAIVEGDDLEIALTTTVDLNDPKVKYGVIKATYKNDNYNILFVGDRDENGEYKAEAKFIITKQQAVLRIKDEFLEAYPTNSKVYDEKPTRIRVENTGGGTVSYFVGGAAAENNFIEPGIYNIVIKGTAKAEFYPPEDLTYTFTIYPREIETDFGEYKATIQDSAGYSTTATFSLVVDKAAETDVLSSFSATEIASSKQITEFYFLQSDGNVSGSMQLDLSKEYRDGDKVTLYIYKNSGEYTIETYQVQNGVITIENADQIQGIGFVTDNNGPGFLMLALYIGGAVLLLALFLLPILARRRH